MAAIPRDGTSEELLFGKGSSKGATAEPREGNFSCFAAEAAQAAETLLCSDPAAWCDPGPSPELFLLFPLSRADLSDPADPFFPSPPLSGGVGYLPQVFVQQCPR